MIEVHQLAVEQKGGVYARLIVCAYSTISVCIKTVDGNNNNSCITKETFQAYEFVYLKMY